MVKMELVNLVPGVLWVYRCPDCKKTESRHVEKRELATFPVPYCDCRAHSDDIRRINAAAILKEKERAKS
jgi:hypothetical protein